MQTRLALEALHAEYAHVLDDGELERWPTLFTEDCFYQIISRENYDQNLPLAAIRCESRGMLEDRVTAVRETYLFEPRYLRHVIGPPRIEDSQGAPGDVIHATTSYAVFETLPDATTQVFNVGRYLDEIVPVDGALRFARKACVFDSDLILNSLVYPI